MRETVLLSIKPEFADKIFCGNKRFEFRRTIFKEEAVRKFIIYASSPVCRVVGECDIEGIYSMSMHSLWYKTRKESGITWQYYSEYFKGKEICHAIKLTNPLRYSEPVTLEEAIGITRPPQSFAYIERTLYKKSWRAAEE